MIHLEKRNQKFDCTVYPSPAKNRIYLSVKDPLFEIYYLKIFDHLGRTIYMLPKPTIAEGIDISHLSAGTYFMQITDARTQRSINKKFIVQ